MSVVKQSTIVSEVQPNTGARTPTKYVQSLLHCYMRVLQLMLTLLLLKSLLKV